MNETISYHSCYDIQGMLNRMKGKRGTSPSIFYDEQGRTVSVAEARLNLHAELAKGRRVMPIGECDNFDYQKGCLGHKKTKESK